MKIIVTDGLETESPTEKQVPLIQTMNCIVTPHSAWMIREARERVMAITKENIEDFLQ